MLFYSPYVSLSSQPWMYYSNLQATDNESKRALLLCMSTEVTCVLRHAICGSIRYSIALRMTDEELKTQNCGTGFNYEPDTIYPISSSICQCQTIITIRTRTNISLCHLGYGWNIIRFPIRSESFVIGGFRKAGNLSLGVCILRYIYRHTQTTMKRSLSLDKDR